MIINFCLAKNKLTLTIFNVILVEAPVGLMRKKRFFKV